jgi:uncharacterized SAM-binding protein YcdF (DUF218 family)
MLMRDAITNYIFIEDENPSGDVAFVFGTGLSLMYAVEQAIRLYQIGSVRKILVTGGVNKKLLFNEAETAYTKLIDAGIPVQDILIENRASNTLENVIFSIPILENAIGLQNIRTIVSVVKNFHARRAAMTLYRHLPKTITIKTCAYIPHSYEFSKNDWHTYDMGKTLVIGECRKIKKYLLQDDIQELPDKGSPLDFSSIV